MTDENGNNVSDHIVKIVEGNYSSLPEAEGQKDIKTELLLKALQSRMKAEPVLMPRVAGA